MLITGHVGIRDLTVHVSSEAEPEYVDALRDKMQATADIVKAFVHIRAQGQAGPLEEETLKRVQETEAEVSHETILPAIAWWLSMASRTPLSDRNCRWYGRSFVTQSRRRRSSARDLSQLRNAQTGCKAGH